MALYEDPGPTPCILVVRLTPSQRAALDRIVEAVRAECGCEDVNWRIVLGDLITATADAFDADDAAFPKEVE